MASGAQKYGAAKIVLLIFNVIFWLSGAAFLGTGVWLLVDSSELSYVISFVSEVDGFDTGQNTIEIVAYLFLSIGFAVFIFGFFGCCGAVRDIRCFLGFFIFFLLLIMTAEIGAGVVAFIYHDQVIGEVRTNGIIYVKETYTNKRSADYGLNYIQAEWNCCGVSSLDDYRNSTFYTDSGFHVSPFCCVQRGSYQFEPRVAGPRNQAVCMNEAQTCQGTVGGCPSPGPMEVNAAGCVDQLITWAKNKLPIFIALGIAIGGLQIIGMATAICVCRNVNKDY